MKTSDRGRAFIAAHEGVVLRAYKDVAGVWTIGVGHTARAGPPSPHAGMTISRGRAMEILAQDLARFEARVRRVAVFKAQAPFDGAVSFDFNTGRIHDAAWVDLYRKGLFARAESSLKKWVHAGGRRWPGLVRRRAAEADLVFRGRYGEVVARAGRRDEVRAYQRVLRRLKFYKGALDGLAGPKTRAAVRAFQRAHPNLVEDGRVGPATRAALDRALDMRKAGGQTAGGALASGGALGVLGAGGFGFSFGFRDPDFWGQPAVLALAVGAIVLVLVASIVAWRYRDELRALAARL